MKKFILFFLIPFITYSQDDILSERPSFNANYLEIAPELDGNILSDDIWKSITSIGPFIQTKPLLGNPSSEETDVRIAFTKDMMFVGVICYDSSPNTLVVSDSRRDANLDNDDSFLFIIDTYNDQQNGFLFGTNSAGMEYDAQIDNEGVGNRTAQRQQGGVIGGTNLNWDASWIVKTEVGEYGWSAEFAIPLKSLRFSPGENKSWGINFQRNISKTNEITYWAPLPLGFNFGIKRVSLAGKMNKVSLIKPGNLKLFPYALTQLTNFSQKKEQTSNFDVGADLKYSITPSLTLDLTYNTDFAQAEVDKQQVNLDRFNLFYPEKRAFFLENAGQFSVGSPGEIDLFFSRRIGISPNGSIVPIIGGGRLSGKIGSTNVGVLSMVTDGVENDASFSTPSVTIDNTPTLVLPILPDSLPPPIIGTIEPLGDIPILLLKKRSISPGLPTENCPAGQFSVGSPGEIDLFFSRRIGISPNGSIVPIIGGGRLSGKIGSTNVGVLSMVTDGVENDASFSTPSVTIDNTPTLVLPILPDSLPPPIIGTIEPLGDIPILLLKKRSISPGLPTENCPAFSRKNALFSG